jgi:hypothetical protein
LVAKLPNLVFEDFKPPIPVLEFKKVLAEHLSSTDMHLLDVHFHQIDNQNLLIQLQNPDYDVIEGGKITADEINTLIAGIKTEWNGIKEVRDCKTQNNFNNLFIKDFTPEIKRFKNKNKKIPGYFMQFVRVYLEMVDDSAGLNGNKQEIADSKTAKEIMIPWEDHLSAMYYEYLMKCPNAFLASWFELNLNINNIFTAYTCQKYNLDRTRFIVGSTEISDKLRTSHAKDYDLSPSVAYIRQVLQIAEEPDWMQRKLKTDRLKWEWLDARVFPQVFDIENIITYWLKLEMLEHWSCLNKTMGKKALQQLLGAMQMKSGHVLEEFRRDNKR